MTGLVSFPLGRVSFGCFFFFFKFIRFKKWPVVGNKGFSIVFPLSRSPKVAAKNSFIVAKLKELS